MGRHGKSVSGPAVPWDVVGWGTFACLVSGAALAWTGKPWRTVALVLVVGVVCLGVVTGLSVSSGRRPARARRRRVDRS